MKKIEAVAIDRYDEGEMVSLVAKFDGEKIELPDELRGAAPGNVLIVYPAGVQAEDVPSASSFRDFCGKGATNRTIDDINAQIRHERDSWDEP